MHDSLIVVYSDLLFSVQSPAVHGDETERCGQTTSFSHHHLWSDTLAHQPIIPTQKVCECARVGACVGVCVGAHVCVCVCVCMVALQSLLSVKATC